MYANFYLYSYIISMTFFYVKPLIFVIDSTFGTFSSELHDVRVSWLRTDKPHEEVNSTFRVSEHILPTLNIFENKIDEKILHFTVTDLFPCN